MAGIPDTRDFRLQGSRLQSGKPVVLQLAVTNNGLAPQALFFDQRLNQTTTIKVANVNPPSSSAGYDLPLTGGSPQWVIPTQTRSVKLSATATLPVMFDYGPFQGDPDLEIGPYAGPAPAGLVNMSLVATTKAFDTSITSPGGDLWQAAVDPNVLGTFEAFIVGPGETVTVPVTITPTGAAGARVSGVVYLDAFENGVPPYGEPTGDEVAAIPYSYTIE